MTWPDLNSCMQPLTCPRWQTPTKRLRYIIRVLLIFQEESAFWSNHRAICIHIHTAYILYTVYIYILYIYIYNYYQDAIYDPTTPHHEVTSHRVCLVPHSSPFLQITITDFHLTRHDSWRRQHCRQRVWYLKITQQKDGHFGPRMAPYLDCVNMLRIFFIYPYSCRSL